MNEATERAAVKLLRAGLANLSEVARLAGTSRQLVRYWCKRDGVNWQDARNKALAKMAKRVGLEPRAEEPF